ncbi:DUF167 family protein [Elioraea thermophila]|uniref:DUF167 family protein n=1 Tax=Elioraea thermophila TaxID=2185104 RepID=UPI000DF23E70|nr:DUF167 family protein [Elioraea thermophila]
MTLPDAFFFPVRVSPRARKAGVLGRTVKPDGSVALRVAVTEPPEEGRANAALCALLADAFGVPSAACRVVRGASARDKLVRIAGDPTALAARFQALTR